MIAVAHAGTHEIDGQTLVRAIARDREATRTLVDRYSVRVFALLSRMLVGRDRATIEDVAQDTFLDVFRKLGSFDPRGSAQLSTWILTIAARRAIDELRRSRPVPIADFERASERPAGLAAAIQRALAELSPDMRAAFVLREYHGLEYVEIADALAIDLGTVKSRLARARSALRPPRSLLAPHAPTDE